MALDRGIPRSTARGWLRDHDSSSVVSTDVIDQDTASLQLEVLALQRKIKRLTGTTSSTPTLIDVGGIENHNTSVDEIVKECLLKRVLEQTEISCSNSMIESFWKSDQTPMVVSEHTRFGFDGSRSCFILRYRAQHQASTLCVQRTNSRRNVLRQRNRHP
jgi:hypothetical protein